VAHREYVADFVVFKRGATVPERSVDRAAMLERVAHFLDRGGDKARAWNRHREPPAVFRTAIHTRERVELLTRNAADGARVLVQSLGLDEVLVVQKLDDRAAGPVPDLGCSPRIEKAHQLLWERFGEEALRSAGRWYCRFVDGTNTVSRHGYLKPGVWQGSAEDIFGEGSMNTMAGLEQIARFLVRRVEAGDLALYTVIYGDEKWRAGEGWQPYGGVFHTHVHYDALGGQPCRP
jgi:hypothetical protein